MPKKLDAEKQQAYAMMDQGKSLKAIAEELKVAYPTVLNWNKKRKGSDNKAASASKEDQLVQMLNDAVKKNKSYAELTVSGLIDALKKQKRQEEYERKKAALDKQKQELDAEYSDLS